jgi:predicted lipoprotein with Yx(FWY)xxD motif
MGSRLLMVATFLVAGAAVLACSSSPGASGAAGSAAPSVAAPSVAAPSVAASVAAPSGAASAGASSASGNTIEAKPVGAAGTQAVVAGSNGMTLYYFQKDIDAADGKSQCTGGCLAKWPALTVPTGTTPTAGAGITGKLGTVVRDDDKTTQVTYNGLPIYFFANDKAPGDANGVYTNWLLVTPDATVPSAGAPASGAPSAAASASAAP